MSELGRTAFRDRFMSAGPILNVMNKISIGPRPYMAAMPTVLVGATVGGEPNFMTASWAGVACMEPPMVSVAINKARHTEKGIAENKVFSLNIPAARNAVESDFCGIVSGKNEDKASNFDVFYGKLASAPMIETFPVNIECELYHTADLGSHNLHIGKVVDVHADESCLTNGAPDTMKVDPIVYSNKNYYRVGETLGKAYSIGKGMRRL